MSATIIVAAAFAVLLGLEWRWRRRGLRVGTALLALAVLYYFQPAYPSARRRVLGTPSTERVTLNPVGGGHDSLSEYHSGVYTAMEWVEHYDGVGAGARFVAVGALFWLACSPALRHVRAPLAADGSSLASSGSSGPEA
jgi:hypothetical protein